MSNGACELSGSVIDLSTLRADALTELIGILDDEAPTNTSDEEYDGAAPKLISQTCLVLDPLLQGALTLTVTEGPKMFKQHSVKDFVELSWFPLQTECKSVVYLVRPNIQSMKQIAFHVKEWEKTRDFHAEKRNWAVYFVPRRSYICEKVLKDEGVYGSLKMREYHLGLLPFDNDVLSMELGETLRQSDINGDQSSLFYVARSVIDLQSMFGMCPRLYAKGTMSRSVIELITRLRREEFASAGRGEEEDIEPEIDAVLFLDRSVDLVSPMCTPLTYEALVDEIIGIEHSYVKMANQPKEDDEKDIASGKAARRIAKLEAQQAKRLTQPWSCASCGDLNPPPQQQRGSINMNNNNNNNNYSLGGQGTVPCRMCGKLLVPIDSSVQPMNSNDDLFASLRDANIQIIQKRINERARELSDYEKSRHDIQDLNEIGRFVKNLSGHQLATKRLAMHIDLIQSITNVTSRREFISQWQSEQAMIERGQVDYDLLENAIAREMPMFRVLRLLCLQSMTCGGFRKYDEFRREILQTYGYEYVFTLDNLEKIGLFRKTNIWDWPKVRNAFGLAVENPDVNKPTDLSYVTSGYAPLTSRIVEMFCRKGWDAMQRPLDLLLGPSISVRQERFGSEPTVGSGNGTTGEAPEQKGGESNKPKVLLVYFLGGVTHMEISAIRLINKRSDGGWKIVIATTNLVNGSSLLREMVDVSVHRPEPER